jgi:hypothetical protein
MKVTQKASQFEDEEAGLRLLQDLAARSPLHADIKQRFEIAAGDLNMQLERVQASHDRLTSILYAGEQRLDDAWKQTQQARDAAQAANEAFEEKRRGLLGDLRSRSEKDAAERAARHLEGAQNLENQTRESVERQELKLRPQQQDQARRLVDLTAKRDDLRRLQQQYAQDPEAFAAGAVSDRGFGSDANRLPAFQAAGGELARQRFERAQLDQQRFRDTRAHDAEFERMFAAERSSINTGYGHRLESIDRQGLGTGERLDSQLEAKQQWHESRAELARRIDERQGFVSEAAGQAANQEIAASDHIAVLRRQASENLVSGVTPNHVREQAGFDYTQRRAMAREDLIEDPRLHETYEHEGVFESPRQAPAMNMAPSWAGGNNQNENYSVQVKHENADERVTDAYVNDVQERPETQEEEARDYRPDEAVAEESAQQDMVVERKKEEQYEI